MNIWYFSMTTSHYSKTQASRILANASSSQYSLEIAFVCQDRIWMTSKGGKPASGSLFSLLSLILFIPFTFDTFSYLLMKVCVEADGIEVPLEIMDAALEEVLLSTFALRIHRNTQDERVTAYSE